MKKSFGSVVDGVIKKSDVVLEIVDARFLDEMINKALEYYVKNRNKQLIIVVNKCDQVDDEELAFLKKNHKDYVFISGTKKTGLNFLLQEIKKKALSVNAQQIVGVLGYPNVGKSSIINSMKGRKSAGTSSEAGFTKGKQYLRIDPHIMMI